MKAALFFLVLVNEAMVLAAPAIELNNDAPPSSGCYPFADPHCGVADTFCHCRDGHFYLFNRAAGGCDPPWGYVGDSVESLPGYHCRK
ncbi:hypothetical protein PENNAL_c0032G01104 [Penicillium nalgiovense]|uniref:Chitin-binding type-2 domain-containing protein n=1 Tax=Penicillium nalgiovense TaxID=60175 RepID=A0A1V6Y7I2_PENNA|nr:hypothetical protein PENNAL_c0032G01104 [Penicillium nalgiovense]